jgi:superfamily I DNA/RNA helicase
MTFDAFTKSLVDRFYSAIPWDWRPTRHFVVNEPHSYDIKEFLEATVRAAPQHWKEELASLRVGGFLPEIVGTYQLPESSSEPQSAAEFVLHRWWEHRLKHWPRSRLGFIEINRLAELLLRVRPQLLAAVRATYPYVFVDEFQDTTYAQYSFLRTAFAANDTRVTAVGDHKQRIMGWAGACHDIFERFAAEFQARRVDLLFNFRASPELVRIQQIVARAIDGNAQTAVARSPCSVDGHAVQLWNSASRQAEVRQIAAWIAADMAARGTRPRDYALLVRQRPEDIEAELSSSFAAVGLRVRNEGRRLGQITLQDLLTDEIAQIALSLLKLGVCRRDPKAWQLVSGAVETLAAADADNERARVEAEAQLTVFLTGLRETLEVSKPDRSIASQVVERLFNFLDLNAIRRTYVQYTRNERLDIIVEAFSQHLVACAEAAAIWSQCLDMFVGADYIALMTVHKSKGREFNTVLFVGLDDKAWWSYTPANPEGLSTFFVALSRATQRVIFLFCRERGGRRRIADLFDLLATAGVPEISVDGNPRYP